MASPHHQLLANSLKIAKKKSNRGVLHANEISRLHLTRLIASGWLTSILRGWYLLKQPIAKEGESTSWYSSFWDFIGVYLSYRFGENYCLSANDSLAVHLGSTTIPVQLLIMVKSGGSSLIKLPFNTSLMIYQEKKSFPAKTEIVNSINVMSLPVALHRVSAQFFQKNPGEAELALKMVDTLELAQELLSGSNIAAAGRIIGAYFFLGEKQKAKQLRDSLIAAGYQPDIINPFIIKEPLLSNYSRLKSPYAARIALMWQEMRKTVIAIFPIDPGMSKNSKNYFDNLEKIYVNDAYNSLSIEGYEVTEKLIQQIADNKWQPDQSPDDKNQLNAMAAKGYLQAFKAVKLSIKRIFQKENSGKVIKEDMHVWYSNLFSALVKAGILEAKHLAGYRSHPVYIRHSMHTPLPKEALLDAMEAYFECLMAEPVASVRAILGHFIFVFIHPYMDGNGRIARFIMNSLFASGGFPWVIISVSNRREYFKVLEQASVEGDIKAFTEFVLNEMKRITL
jgi:hypothetical protein